MKTILTSAFAVLSLVIAGCGGGGDSAPAPEAAPAKAEAPAAAADPAPAAPAGGYVGMDAVADAGSIGGTISYAGERTDQKVKISKDGETCERHSSVDASERPGGALLVADGKLANAVVWIDGITTGKKYEATDVAIDNKDCAFVPHVAIGHKGMMINATNSDPVLHNTNLTMSSNGKSMANIALPQQGQTVGKKLKKTGVHTITCDAHEWMKAHLVVVNHPYAAVTGADGSFSMGDVPAGDYTVKIWHEVLGEAEAKVTVAAGGAATADHAFN